MLFRSLGVDYTDYTMNDKNRLESKLTDNTRQLLDYTSDQKIRKFSVLVEQLIWIIEVYITILKTAVLWQIVRQLWKLKMI